MPRRLVLAVTSVIVLVLAAPLAGSTSPVPTVRKLKVAVVGGGRVVSLPRGIACPPRCVATFPAGTRVTLSPRPAAGFLFAQWRGCAARGICRLTLRAPRSVVAVFDLEPDEPPEALPGHYAGKTSHETEISFDVTDNSRRVENLLTGHINVSCNPPFRLSGVQVALQWIPIAGDDTFGYAWTGPSRVGQIPATYTLEVSGRFSAGTATGTIRAVYAFTWADGKAYECDSGVVTFTAARS